MAKEEAKRLANEKAEKKLKEKRQKAMSKLLNSSKNLTNMNKMGYLKRFENGENYNALKQNIVGKIRNLADKKKKKEENEEEEEKIKTEIKLSSKDAEFGRKAWKRLTQAKLKIVEFVLKSGYDAFEMTKLPPEIRVEDRHYVVKAVKTA